MTIEQNAGTRTAAPEAIPAGEWGLAPELTEDAAARIAGAVSSSRAEGTRRTYASAWRRFEKWCTANGHTALPAHPMTVAAYLVDAADTYDTVGERAYSPSTLARWVAAIGYHHRVTGHPTPHTHELVRSTLSGIRRTYAAAGDRPRTPRAGHRHHRPRCQAGCYRVGGPGS